MEGFGQTETVVAIATFPWMEPKPGSLGKPTPGYMIELMDKDGRLCEAGEEGEIVMNPQEEKPRWALRSLRGRSSETKEAWHDGYYHTGDMAWMDEEGYFWFVGRADGCYQNFWIQSRTF